jgi:hypothetical protein
MFRRAIWLPAVLLSIVQASHLIRRGTAMEDSFSLRRLVIAGLTLLTLLGMLAGRASASDLVDD